MLKYYQHAILIMLFHAELQSEYYSLKLVDSVSCLNHLYSNIRDTRNAQK